MRFVFFCVFMKKGCVVFGIIGVSVSGREVEIIIWCFGGVFFIMWVKEYFLNLFFCDFVDMMNVLYNMSDGFFYMLLGIALGVFYLFVCIWNFVFVL